MRKSVLIGLGLAVLAGVEVEALPLRESLAMLETGAARPQRSAADRMRGSNGEVSRYQIMPRVWRQYCRVRDYENPDLAWQVAQHILTDRIARFRRLTNREPSPTEIYLLWNKPGHFEAVGFVPERVKRTYHERARRFANLMSAPRFAMVTAGGPRPAQTVAD